MRLNIYLITNTNLKNLNKNELMNYQKILLIRQILKREEIKKYFKFEKNSNLVKNY